MRGRDNSITLLIIKKLINDIHHDRSFECRRGWKSSRLLEECTPDTLTTEALSFANLSHSLSVRPPLALPRSCGLQQ